jgi:hypothetical protein
MNAIVTRTGGTGLISREDLAKSLNNAAMSMPSVGGDKAFLKMDKNNGEWLFGQEETVIENNSLWAANPMSLKHGWVAWDTNAGGAPVQEIMVPINRPLPPVDSLPELPMGTPDKKTGARSQLQYQAQRSVDFVCVSGEDEETIVEYKQSSTGAMKLFGALTNALLDQVQKGDEIVAVGNLTFDKYKHKQYGWIHNPVFQIIEWRTMDDTAPPVAEAVKEPEPVEDTGRRRARPAAVATQAAVAEAVAVDVDKPSERDEAELAKEYESERAKAQMHGEAENPTPRRRMRR